MWILQIIRFVSANILAFNLDLGCSLVLTLTEPCHASDLQTDVWYLYDVRWPIIRVVVVVMALPVRAGIPSSLPSAQTVKQSITISRSQLLARPFAQPLYSSSLSPQSGSSSCIEAHSHRFVQCHHVKPRWLNNLESARIIECALSLDSVLTCFCIERIGPLPPPSIYAFQRCSSISVLWFVCSDSLKCVCVWSICLDLNTKGLSSHKRQCMVNCCFQFGVVLTWLETCSVVLP